MNNLAKLHLCVTLCILNQILTFYLLLDCTNIPALATDLRLDSQTSLRHQITSTINESHTHRLNNRLFYRQYRSASAAIYLWTCPTRWSDTEGTQSCIFSRTCCSRWAVVNRKNYINSHIRSHISERTRRNSNHHLPDANPHPRND